MATINISDLRPTGSDLFSDSEGYMNELGDSELDIINGGFSTPFCVVVAIRVSVIVSVAASAIVTTARAAH